VATLLLADDDRSIRTHLTRFLESLGHRVLAAGDGLAALARLAAEPVDLVLSDVRMPGLDGVELLRAVRERRPDALVILMTAYATVPGAVEAMRAGAFDYLTKPFALDELAATIDRALELTGLRRENRRLKCAVGEEPLLESASPAMRRVLETARRAAASDATVLLTGESGTGKNVLAAAIHRWSARAAHPFVAIACTTLSEHLLESELFGHVKGAFTGAWKDKPGRLEAAEGGSVFLDEIGELPPELQAKLLRVLEERRFERVGGERTLFVDLRVVAATNRDLEEEIAAGRFRRDLFYRLAVVALHVPPLRERAADLPALVEHVLAGIAARYRRPMPDLSAAARAALERHAWPGNVRELVNVLERALVLSPGDTIDADALPDALVAPAAPDVPALPGTPPSSLGELERRHVREVLAASTTLEEAAARLGINPTTLWRKRKRWGLE